MRTPDKAIDRPAITVVSGEIREHARGSRDERVSVETVSAKPSGQKTEQREGEKGTTEVLLCPENDIEYQRMAASESWRSLLPPLLTHFSLNKGK